MNHILDTLADFSYLNSTEVLSKLSEIEELKSKVSLTPEGLNKLSHYRVLSSSTLSRLDELSSWDNANAWVFKNIEAQVTLSGLLDLNSILLNASSKLRDEAIYTGPWEYIKSDQLSESLGMMFETIKEIDNPLLRACELYIWIVTLHPFSNGNGRTSRITADWLLLQNGYLPLCFDSRISSYVANTIDGKKRDKKESILKSLNAIKRAYEICM